MGADLWHRRYPAGFAFTGQYRRKGYFFIAAMAVCTVVEYGTSWILEVFFHARWWDYSGQFLNLHGRICFVSIVGFSLIGLWAVQAVVPVCAGWISKS